MYNRCDCWGPMFCIICKPALVRNSVYNYRVVLEDNTEVKHSVLAITEGDAFKIIDRTYPKWYSVELL